ncbi:hypothetical protein GCM10027188_18190 [Lysobacter humi (ex Lee et al. 2017)]
MPAAARVDGRNQMAWLVVPQVGFSLLYFAVGPERMLQWRAPCPPRLDVAQARALIDDCERDPANVACVLWVWPRSRATMGPTPRAVGCRRAGAR